MSKEDFHNYHHVFPWHHAFSDFASEDGMSANFLLLLNKIAKSTNAKLGKNIATHRSKNVNYGSKSNLYEKIP